MEEPASPRRRRLPRGSHALSRDEVVRIQRARLLEGMVEAVHQRGYLATRVADVLEHAGVSRTSFYDLFSSKEDCFLAARDAIVEGARAAIVAGTRALQPDADAESVLRWYFGAVAGAAREHPREARLLVVDILSLGADGPGSRRATTLEVEALLRERLEAAAPGAFSPTAITAIVGGAQQVLYNRLRRNQADELRSLVDPLTRWALAYQGTPEPAPPTAAERAAAARPQRSVVAARRLPSGRHSLPRSFVAHNQRERVLQAVTAVTAAHGYAGLTVPRIAETAGISHQTFYEHFTNKHEAFLAAIETTITQLFNVAWNAYATGGDFAPAVRSALEAYASFLAADPSIAKFATNDALTGGPDAAEVIDESIGAFANLLTRGMELLPPDLRPPAIAPYAVIGAIFELTARHVADGRARELRAYLDQLAYVALTPFVGAAGADSIAEAG